MILRVIEPTSRCEGPILVGDEDNNDVAEFFHCEQATVATSYETALLYARSLVEAVNEGALAVARERFLSEMGEEAF